MGAHRLSQRISNEVWRVKVRNRGGHVSPLRTSLLSSGKRRWREFLGHLALTLYLSQQTPDDLAHRARLRSTLGPSAWRGQQDGGSTSTLAGPAAAPGLEGATDTPTPR